MADKSSINSPKYQFLHGIRALQNFCASLSLCEINVSGEDKKDTSMNTKHSDPNSPYYLSCVDYPINVLSLIILNGRTYVNWFR